MIPEPARRGKKIGAVFLLKQGLNPARIRHGMKRWIISAAALTVVVLVGIGVWAIVQAPDSPDPLKKENVTILPRGYFYSVVEITTAVPYTFTVKAKDSPVTIAMGEVGSGKLEGVSQEDILKGLATFQKNVEKGQVGLLSGKLNPGNHGFFVINWDKERPAHVDIELTRE
jgi:hypothetical protein